MTTHRRPWFTATLCPLLLVCSALGAEGDWPRWRGPRGDGVSAETGLLPAWPEEGPPQLWRVPLGAGFSAVSVVGNKAYTMYATEQGEYVVSISADDGTVLWKTRSGDLFEEAYGNGPRATPTIDDGRLYALGAAGALLCLDAADGRRIWGYNVLEKFGAEVPEYGCAASPVVVGQRLIVVVGAQDGKSLAVLDKSNGDVLWTSLDDKAGYSTPVAIRVDGTDQVAVLTGRAVVGVTLEEGRPLWRHPWITTLDANVATPIYHEGRLFVASGYGTGCAVFRLSRTGGTAAAEQLWANKNMKNYFSTSLLIDGYLYGFNNTMLACIDFETGQLQWVQRGFNRGSLTAADGKLIVLGERGTLALAEISPKQYKEISRFQVFEGKSWTVPTLSDGKLFVRNEEELACYRLKP